MQSEIRGIREGDCRELARLRQAAAGSGHLSGLGVRTTAALFRAAAGHRLNSVAFAAFASDGYPIGYAIATPNTNDLYRRAILVDPSILPGLIWRAASRRGFLSAGVRALVGGPTGRHGDGALTLLDIAVAPAQRGQGVGRHLVDAVLVEARRRGYSSVALSVVAGNESATSLYRRAGFSEIGRSQLDDGRTSVRMLHRLA